MDVEHQPWDSTYAEHTYPRYAEHVFEHPYICSSNSATEAELKYLTNEVPSVEQSVLPHIVHETSSASPKSDFAQQVDTFDRDVEKTAPFASSPAMWEENLPGTLPTTPASSFSSDEPDQDSLSQEKRASVGDTAFSGDDVKEEPLRTEEETLHKLTEDVLEPATTSAKAKSKVPGKRRKNKHLSPRFAIKTRSNVDVIDDGYKWRKYGQKAVKNSPYHRSYYRCTNKHCFVKKHVERFAQDAEYVLTTYEGSHTHPSPTPIQVVYQPVCLTDGFPFTDVQRQHPALRFSSSYGTGYQSRELETPWLHP
eukprot:c17921_g1_i1 orf=2-928(+)